MHSAGRWKTWSTVSAGIWTGYQNALCWIEYGLTTAYGQSASLLLSTNENIPYTAGTNFVSTLPFQAISQHTPSFNLSSLLSGREYHCRFAASNSVGVAYGPDAVFTTLGNPPPTLSIALSNAFVQLAWTNTATNYALQETPALTGPAWNIVLTNPVITNGMLRVTLPSIPSQRYFRLLKQ